MSQSRSVTIDEFVEHEFTINERFLVVLNVFRQVVQELGLNATESFCCQAAVASQVRVRFFPIPKLIGALTLCGDQLDVEVL